MGVWWMVESLYITPGEGGGGRGGGGPQPLPHKHTCSFPLPRALHHFCYVWPLCGLVTYRRLENFPSEGREEEQLTLRSVPGWGTPGEAKRPCITVGPSQAEEMRVGKRRTSRVLRNPLTSWRLIYLTLRKGSYWEPLGRLIVWSPLRAKESLMCDLSLNATPVGRKVKPRALGIRDPNMKR